MGVSNGGIVATPDWTLIAGDESWADKLVLATAFASLPPKLHARP